MVQSTLAELRPDLAEIIASGQILPSSWYPIDWWSDLHAAARRALGAGPEFAREMGRLKVKKDLSGIYRVFSWSSRRLS